VRIQLGSSGDRLLSPQADRCSPSAISDGQSITKIFPAPTNCSPFRCVIRCVPAASHDASMPAQFAVELNPLRPAHPAAAWEQRHATRIVPPRSGRTCRWTRSSSKLSQRDGECSLKLPLLVFGPLVTALAPLRPHQPAPSARRWAGWHGTACDLALTTVTPQGNLGPMPKRRKTCLREGPANAYKIGRHARPRPPTARGRDRDDETQPRPLRLSDLEQAVRSLARSRTRARNTTTKPCRPTSTKAEILLNVAPQALARSRRPKITDEDLARIGRC